MKKNDEELELEQQQEEQGQAPQRQYRIFPVTEVTQSK
jgi:hypothetical protein